MEEHAPPAKGGEGGGGEGEGGEGEGGGGEGEGGKNGQATLEQHPASTPHPQCKCGQQPQYDPEGFQHELLQ
jgi:hypothetical protein